MSSTFFGFLIRRFSQRWKESLMSIYKFTSNRSPFSLLALLIETCEFQLKFEFLFLFSLNALTHIEFLSLFLLLSLSFFDWVIADRRKISNFFGTFFNGNRRRIVTHHVSSVDDSRNSAADRYLRDRLHRSFAMVEPSNDTSTSHQRTIGDRNFIEWSAQCIDLEKNSICSNDFCRCTDARWIIKSSVSISSVSDSKMKKIHCKITTLFVLFSDQNFSKWIGAICGRSCLYQRNLEIRWKSFSWIWSTNSLVRSSRWCSLE